LLYLQPNAAKRPWRLEYQEEDYAKTCRRVAEPASLATFTGSNLDHAKVLTFDLWILSKAKVSNALFSDIRVAYIYVRGGKLIYKALLHILY
jgi:hypothetical protein